MLEKVGEATQVLQLLTLHHSRLPLLLIHKGLVVLLCLLIGLPSSARFESLDRALPRSLLPSDHIELLIATRATSG